MKFLISRALLCVLTLCMSMSTAQSIEFVIVIPSYNNYEWAVDTLRSACFQRSTKPYRVIYINDCSTDGTGDRIEEFVREQKLESLVTIIHNDARVGQLANWYNTIHTYVPDHKIVVNLDGDDILYNDEVLLTLENYYRDPDVWLTYGSAVRYPRGGKMEWVREVPRDVLLSRALREYPFTYGHLRTFKAGLFKKVALEDLLYEGKFFPCAADQAFMIPMMEMCAPRDKEGTCHSKYVPEILYHYRINNPINFFATQEDVQKEMALRVRAQRPYAPISSLSDTPQYDE